MPIEFQAILERGLVTDAVAYITTASTHGALLGRPHGRVALHVDINGRAFRADGWPSGTGAHLIPVPVHVLRASGLRAGDRVSVRIERR